MPGTSPARRSITPRARLTWYRPGLFYGNHEFKSGFDYTDHDLSRGWINRPATAGNYQLVFRNGVPFALNTWNYPLKPHNVTHYLGIYGTDSWSVTHRLTLDLGLRYRPRQRVHSRGVQRGRSVLGRAVLPERCSSTSGTRSRRGSISRSI